MTGSGKLEDSGAERLDVPKTESADTKYFNAPNNATKTNPAMLSETLQDFQKKLLLWNYITLMCAVVALAFSYTQRTTTENWLAEILFSLAISLSCISLVCAFLSLRRLLISKRIYGFELKAGFNVLTIAVLIFSIFTCFYTYNYFALLPAILVGLPMIISNMGIQKQQMQLKTAQAYASPMQYRQVEQELKQDELRKNAVKFIFASVINSIVGIGLFCWTLQAMNTGRDVDDHFNYYALGLFFRGVILFCSFLLGIILLGCAVNALRRNHNHIAQKTEDINVSQNGEKHEIGVSQGDHKLYIISIIINLLPVILFGCFVVALFHFS